MLVVLKVHSKRSLRKDPCFKRTALKHVYYLVKTAQLQVNENSISTLQINRDFFLTYQ